MTLHLRENTILIAGSVSTPSGQVQSSIWPMMGIYVNMCVVTSRFPSSRYKCSNIRLHFHQFPANYKLKVTVPSFPLNLRYIIALAVCFNCTTMDITPPPHQTCSGVQYPTWFPQTSSTACLHHPNWYHSKDIAPSSSVLEGIDWFPPASSVDNATSTGAFRSTLGSCILLQ